MRPKNQLFVLTIFLFLSSFLAASSEASDGRDSVADFCRKQYSYSTNLTDQCMEIVRESAFFDDKAVQLCKAFSYSNTLTNQCFKAISGRKYLKTEIELCEERKYSTTLTLDCLKKYGRAFSGLSQDNSHYSISYSSSTVNPDVISKLAYIDSQLNALAIEIEGSRNEAVLKQLKQIQSKVSRFISKQLQ